MVCTSTAIAVTAARKSALRGGSRKARPPTGTQQQEAEAARDSAGGVQQQDQARDVDRRLNDGQGVGARHALANQHDARESEAQIRQRDDLKKSCGDSTGSPREPPSQYRPRSTSGTSTRYRFRIPRTRQLRPILGPAPGSIFRFATFTCFQRFWADFALDPSLIQNTAPRCDGLGSGGSIMTSAILV